jgi:hypothetical protein
MGGTGGETLQCEWEVMPSSVQGVGRTLGVTPCVAGDLQYFREEAA